MAIYKHTWTHWDALDALTSPELGVNGSSRRDPDNPNCWHGATLADAIRMVKDGWLEVVDTIAVRPTTSIGDVDRPTLQWSETGSDIDIATYLSGIPECMGEMVNLPQPKPLIRIGIDASVSAYVRSEDIKAVGRSVLTVVESLRARGYPTEIWSCASQTNYSGNIFDGRLLVQSSSAPVHVGRVAFWTAHTAAFRRAWFALFETVPSDERHTFGFYDGYGYSIPNPDYAKSEYDEWAPSAQNGQARATEWINEVLGRHA